MLQINLPYVETLPFRTVLHTVVSTDDSVLSLRYPITVSAFSHRTITTNSTFMMAAQGNGQATACFIRPNYTYRTMNSIIYDIIPVTHGTVNGDYNDETARGLNNLRSALW